jgi:hypothetical protein
MRSTFSLFRRLATLLLFAVVLWAIVATAQLEGQAAVSPKQRSDTALRNAVASEMSPKQLRNSARQIALSDPMHAVGFFLEVMALDIEKNPSIDQRRGLIAQASLRQPSFAAPRIWLTAYDIRNKRYAQAVDGADTVMRLNGDFRKLLVPILVPLLAESQSSAFLEKKLKTFPIWRAEFLSEAIKAGAYDAKVESMLRQTPPQHYAVIMAAERSAYLKALVARGEAVHALKVWRSFAQGEANPSVFDGNFKMKNPIFPFAWSYASESLSYAEKVAAPEGGGVLVRAYHGGNGKIALLSQLVQLKSGSNLLRITMRDGGLAKPEKFFWRVRCLDAMANIASQSLGKLGEDWQKIQMQFTVPENGCPLQYLSLEAEDNGGDEAEVEIRQLEIR